MASRARRLHFLKHSLVCGALSAALVPQCIARASNDDQEQMKNLVVVVQCDLDGNQQFGAGVIFGQSPDRLYILTANHTVRRTGAEARRVAIQTRWSPGQWIGGALLNVSNAQLDLAVLSIPLSDSIPLLHFDRLGDSSAMQPGTQVYALGHPSQRLWELALHADAVTRADGLSIYFRSGILAPGHSGGALLNEKWEIIGMLRSDAPPNGEAIDMNRILMWLESMKFPMDLRPPGSASTLAEFETSIQEDVTYYCASLASFPEGSPDGEEILKKLTPALDKLQTNPRFRNSPSATIASLYRCIGGAYLLDKSLNVPDKLPKALPFLKLSVERDPSQALLAQDITTLSGYVGKNNVDGRQYMTTVMQVLRGNDPKIPDLVNQVMGYVNGPEYQAQQWLLQSATKPSLQDLLDALKIMAKKDKNLDLELEVTSKTLPNGHVEVQAKLGPNVFLWEVDISHKTYLPRNTLTQQFMERIASTQNNP